MDGRMGGGRAEAKLDASQWVLRACRSLTSWTGWLVGRSSSCQYSSRVKWAAAGADRRAQPRLGDGGGGRVEDTGTRAVLSPAETMPGVCHPAGSSREERDRK